jgi:hypothetical protein
MDTILAIFRVNKSRKHTLKILLIDLCEFHDAIQFQGDHFLA